MTNKFINILSKLMTSTRYLNEEEVLDDLEALREEYLILIEALESERQRADEHFDKWDNLTKSLEE